MNGPNPDDADELADTRAYIFQLEQAHDQRLADLNVARAEIVTLREALLNASTTARSWYIQYGTAAKPSENILAYWEERMRLYDATLLNTTADYAHLTTIPTTELAALRDKAWRYDDLNDS